MSPLITARRAGFLASAFILGLFLTMASVPAFAAANGLDTPSGIGDMPFGVQGTQVMDLTNTGLGINLTGPTQALDVSGYVRIRNVNGEGATIQMDGANGTTMYVENINGTFRLVNNPWNMQLFSVDQSGNLAAQGTGDFIGSSLTVGGGGPGTLHLYGSTVYDTGSYLHLGSGYTYADGNLVVAGTTTSSNEFIGTMQGGYGQFRMVGGNYGSFWRNDGANTYLLLTNMGNPYGAWNGLRPMYINDASGVVSFNQGITLTGGGITFPDGSVQTTAFQSGSMSIGGFYYLAQGVWPGCTPNPRTGGCNCPGGYNTWQAYSGASNGTSYYIGICWK